MNDTLKNILTSPMTIGGTVLGLGIAVGALIYAKNRPKTEGEIELAKIREANAEAQRERDHSYNMEKVHSQQALDEVEAQEKTKRDAKAQEERTKQLELEIQKIKEQHEWEKTAPQGYWDLKIAEAKAAGDKAAADKEHDTQREIARLQAEAARYSAEANARATKEREYYAYKRQESADNAEMNKVQAIATGVASMVTGKVN